MTLLGDRAWRLPAWLDRLLPRFDLEGDERPDRPSEPRERERRPARFPSGQPAPADAREG